MQHYLNSNTDFHVPPEKLGDFYNSIGSTETLDADSIARAGYGAMDGAANGFIATGDAAAATPQIGFNTNALSQFFQFWQNGIVRASTAPRNAEKILGYTQAGNFETETIVVRSLEQHAGVSLYGDIADVEQASYTATYPFRHVVRFQSGLETTLLEEKRQQTVGISGIEEKRAAIRRAFAINENAVNLFGYNGGINKTYGLFNDPNIEAYNTLPNGVSASPLWSTKTWLEKVNDIIATINRIVINTNTGFNPTTDKFCWVIPPYVQTQLAGLNDLGTQSIHGWIKETYPNMRIETLPELAGLNGGADAWYMFKESAMDVDDSTDDGQVIGALTQSKMFLISSLPNVSGGVSEKYACALAGVLVKRPILVTRFTGMN